MVAVMHGGHGVDLLHVCGGVGLVRSVGSFGIE